jgi:hypothetical protein
VWPTQNVSQLKAVSVYFQNHRVPEGEVSEQLLFRTGQQFASAGALAPRV